MSCWTWAGPNSALMTDDGSVPWPFFTEELCHALFVLGRSQIRFHDEGSWFHAMSEHALSTSGQVAIPVS